ncbi:hypothetical protein G5I_07962 [Acromyrmex echinatior]|uniref:Uncharacterized protein n=1 Tax=Acromyrmex echinatior TaxID=103372 RepID=F4WQ78_ACREC|nr:hypothetical protein G5I_07962 [Acromyrmex echinatior]
MGGTAGDADGKGELDGGCDGAGPLAAEVKVRRCTVENPLSESGPFAVLGVTTPIPASLLWRPSSSQRSYWLSNVLFAESVSPIPEEVAVDLISSIGISSNDEDVAHVGLFNESEPHEFQVKTTMMMRAIQGRGIDRGKNRSA